MCTVPGFSVHVAWEQGYFAFLRGWGSFWSVRGFLQILDLVYKLGCAD